MVMRIETKFVQNYLSKSKFSYGIESVILVLGLCLTASLLYWNPHLEISKSLAASYTTVLEGDYWRLFSTSFVHGGIDHLLSNSLMLSFLTYFVCSYYGSIVGVVFSFIVAMLTNLIVLKIYGGSTSLVGASGVVYYLWGFWMILYMFLQTQYSIIGRSLRMGAVFLVLLVPTEYQPSTSYLAHGIGFLLGVFAGLVYYVLNRKVFKEAEVWEIKELSDDLTELDLQALTYPLSSEDIDSINNRDL